MSKPNSLAMAFEISKRRKKKMAKGGMVNESARSEHRPMPEETDKDQPMVSRNDSKKSLVEAQWDSRPDIKQSTKGMRTTPIKHPKMVPSTGFSSKLRDQEDDLQSSASVNNGPQRQPPEQYNEEEADKSGPEVPSLHMKRMAKGGMINNEVSMHDAEEDHVVHPEGLEEDNDQMRPSRDEYMADHFAEGGEVPGSQKEKDVDGCTVIRGDTGYGKIIQCADGGEIEEDHDASVAAAIMAKRRKMAEGGQVDIDSNAEEQPNGYYSRNEDAALKENYDSDMDDVSQPMNSNEHSVSIDSDVHDMVSAIRRKIMAKRRA